MKNNIFSGDLESLKNHWENSERAKKFLSGGTRTIAVHRVIDKIKIHISDNIWVDIAPGSGFVQSQLGKAYLPVFFVGIDFSRKMLNCMDKKYGERVQGSVFAIPLRSECADITSIFFSLSDYPNLNDGLYQISRVCRDGGFVSFTDYGENDEYWVTRVKLDGTIIGEKKITGNINLRGLGDIIGAFPSNMNMKVHSLIKYNVPASEFNSNFTLPEIVLRSFLFVLARKTKDIGINHLN